MFIRPYYIDSSRKSEAIENVHYSAKKGFPVLRKARRTATVTHSLYLIQGLGEESITRRMHDIKGIGICCRKRENESKEYRAKRKVNKDRTFKAGVRIVLLGLVL